ncbi:MAG: PHP domain-containing protein [Chloroflexota bacterium]|nr:PHP domain-containing protein [Chloroflexota bacterium]
MKADLHVHTGYSPDCVTSLEDIIARCLRNGIDCLAITDHNTIAGAVEMKKLAPFKVIVGEEIDTSSGEIIGYFLHEEIPQGLSAQETIARIKKQGGAVCVPHPFDTFRLSALRREVLESLVTGIDIIEVLNSRLILLRHADMARRFAESHGLLMSAGSDAHTCAEVGNAYVEMPDFNDRNHFLDALAQGRLVGRRSSPWVRFRSNWAKLRKVRQPR